MRPRRQGADDKPDLLAVSIREAARMLGIGERTLWALAKAKEIPHFRAGRRLLFPVHALRTWMDKRAGLRV